MVTGQAPSPMMDGYNREKGASSLPPLSPDLRDKMSFLYGIAKEEIDLFDIVVCKIDPETGLMEIYKARADEMEPIDKDG